MLKKLKDNQIKKIKIVTFDRGDEYYRRYDESGQPPTLFDNLLYIQICFFFGKNIQICLKAHIENFVNEKLNAVLLKLVCTSEEQDSITKKKNNFH